MSRGHAKKPRLGAWRWREKRQAKGVSGEVQSRRGICLGAAYDDGDQHNGGQPDAGGADGHELEGDLCAARGRAVDGCVQGGDINGGGAAQGGERTEGLKRVVGKGGFARRGGRRGEYLHHVRVGCAAKREGEGGVGGRAAGLDGDGRKDGRGGKVRGHR